MIKLTLLDTSNDVSSYKVEGGPSVMAYVAEGRLHLQGLNIDTWGEYDAHRDQLGRVAEALGYNPGSAHKTGWVEMGNQYSECGRHSFTRY
jgi:hypothetical protein